MKSFSILIAIVICTVSAFNASSAELPENPYAELQIIPRVEDNFKIDGIISEAEWNKALKLNVGFEVRPAENIPAPVKTELLLAFSESTLYAAIIAYDPEPGKIRARITDRDELWDDDWAGLMLDTFNDERRSFDFICNPLGVQSDFIEGLDSGGEIDVIWDSMGRINSEGYVIEMAIPFSSIRFQRTDGDQIWGLDCVRSYPRNVRHHIGLFPRDRNHNNYWAQLVKIKGFAGAVPGKNIEIDPTLVGLLSYEREDETSGPMQESTRSMEPGVTAIWGITPNMTLSSTVNPDFAQVEADARQLDVNTQFALYYEEKRPFFLEAGDFFDTRLNAVHTRTLADPNWGMKLTGKEGPNTIGFFTVEDDETNLIFPSSESSEVESLEMKSTGSVLRYKRDFGESSNLGMLITDREGEDYYNRLASVDGSVRFTKVKHISFQFLQSQTYYPADIDTVLEQPSGAIQGNAVEVNFLHGTNNLDYYAYYKQIDKNVRADLGFMPQVDYRYMTGGWGYSWWSNDNDHWWNMLNFGNGYEYREKVTGGLIMRDIEFWANYAGPRETESDAYMYFGEKVYDGKYFDVTYFDLDFETQINKDVRFEISFWGGKDIDYDNSRAGTEYGFNPGVNFKLGRHLNLEMEYVFEKMEVAEGWLYNAHIARMIAIYNITRRVFIRGIFQYVYYDYNLSLFDDDDQEEEEKGFYSQLLFSYKLNPQTVFYLGYSDNYAGNDNDRLIQSNKTIFAKIGYALVF